MTSRLKKIFNLNAGRGDNAAGAALPVRVHEEGCDAVGGRVEQPEDGRGDVAGAVGDGQLDDGGDQVGSSRAGEEEQLGQEPVDRDVERRPEVQQVDNCPHLWRKKASRWNATFLSFSLQHYFDQYNLTWPNLNIHHDVILDHWNHARDFETNFEQNLKELLYGKNHNVGE